MEPGRRVQVRDAPWQVREAPEVATIQHLGLRVSAAARALADAALDRDVADKALRVGFDDARGRRLLRRFDATEEWSNGPTHAGARRLRPRCQVWVLSHVRVDFLFEPAALVVEYLGGQHEGQLEADSHRTLQILAAGYELIPVTAGMAATPRVTAARIHRIRALRERLVTAGLLPIPTLPAQPPR